MSFVRVPDEMKAFRKWVAEVTNSAQMRFGTRAKSIGSKGWRRRRRRRRRAKKTTQE